MLIINKLIHSTGFFLLGTCLSCHAAHPLISDDPFVQGMNNHQIELNTDQTRTPRPLQNWANLTYTYGILDNSDLFLNLTGRYSAVDGAGDHSIGLKHRLNADSDISWGLKAELFWPSASLAKGLGGEQKQLRLSLLRAHDLQNQNLMLLSNVSLGLRRSVSITDKGNYDVRLSQAVLYSYSNELKLVADLSLQLNEQRIASYWDKQSVLGLIYSPNKNCDLDLGLRWQQQRPGWQRSIGAGLTLRM